MYLKNLIKTRPDEQVIDQIKQCKSFDPVQKQMQKNLTFTEQQLPNDQQQLQKIFFSIQQSQKTQRINDHHYKKYATNQLTQAKTMSKISDYHSEVENSTQPASPHYKFSTQHKATQDIISQDEQNSVKKKLFHQETSERNSPRFNLNLSNYQNLAFTFKKKIEQYPRLFSQISKEDFQSTGGRINFSKLNFSTDSKIKDSKQNDSWKLNIEPEENINIKRKLNFQQVCLRQQNQILKQINQEIKRERQTQQKSETDYKISRRNQIESIKRKILESKSDLKRFYEINSQSVEYEYRKAKFMDIFLGTRSLEHSLR